MLLLTAMSLTERRYPDEAVLWVCRGCLRLRVTRWSCSMQAKTKGSARIIQKTAGWACARSGNAAKCSDKGRCSNGPVLASVWLLDRVRVS
jgi:hypothetical protein